MQKAQKSIVAVFTQHYLLLLLLLGYFIVRYQFWEAPMERDEGIYAYFGQLMADGKTPYVDFYEHRLPGIFYAYWLLVIIFGTFKGLAAGITVLNMSSIALMYVVAKNWLGRGAAIWAAVALAFLSLAPEISGHTRQSEHIVAFVMMWGLFALQRALAKNSYLWFVLSGFLMCTSMLIKPNGVFFIMLGGLVTVLYYLFKKEYKNLFKYATVYSLSVFACFGALLLVMLKNGTLDDMWYWSITYAAQYATALPLSEGLMYFGIYFDVFIEYYWWVFIPAMLGLLVSFALLKKTTQQQAATTEEVVNPYEVKPLFLLAFTWVFFIFAFLTITPGNRFYGHYWLMWVPSLAFNVAVLHKVISNFMPNNMVKLAVHGVFGVLVAVHFSQRSDYYAKPNMLKISRRAYSTNPFPEALVIGKHINKKVKKGDEIAVIGSEPELYIYTDCRAPSRHAYFTYLLTDTTQTPALEWQEEFKRDIDTRKPRFLVAFQHRMSLGVQPNADLKILDWVAGVINTQYNRIGIVDDLGSDRPTYMWIENYLGEAEVLKFRQYAPKGTYNAQVFERKPETTNQ